MLNPFPILLTFGIIAPALLRVTVGLIFLYFSYETLRSRRDAKIVCFDEVGLKPGKYWVPVAGAAELVGGILLIAGLWTQVAAILLSIVTIGALIMKSRGGKEVRGPALYYILLFAVLISLMLTGAGFLAFDIPL